MGALRVLLPVHTAGVRGGVQAYVFDLARELLRAGHAPVVYSTILGEVAAAMREATIPVIDDLSQLAAAPDVINGHSGEPETMTAILHFPGVPAIFACHAWMSEIPRSPRIVKYVAVDDTCRDHLVSEKGIPEDRVVVIPNTVDLARFEPRAPLPSRPSRALVFGTMGTPGSRLDLLREAVRSCGLELDVVGWLGETHARPEQLLRDYDLVFAKARCALEAMAVGNAVVLCDYGRLGPLVRSGDIERLRRLNFGVRAIDQPLTHEGIVERVRAYDPLDAALCSRAIRESAGTETARHAWIDLYEAVIEEYRRAPPDPAAEGRAAAAYVRALSVRALAWDRLGGAIQRLATRLRAFGDRLKVYRLGAWFVGKFRTRTRHW